MSMTPPDTPTTKIIAYYRVSTSKQGVSGLGLEAQLAAVERFASGRHVAAAFTEIETATNKRNRPELAKALALTKQLGGTLVVAKLDRLSRNVAFVSALMDSGVEFVCCDMPFANRLTLHILAAVAEHESECISQRTKAALQAARARGTLLGAQNPQCRHPFNPNYQKMGNKFAVIKIKERYDKYYKAMRAYLEPLACSGLSSADIADKLNAAGFTTIMGAKWNARNAYQMIINSCPELLHHTAQSKRQLREQASAEKVADRRSKFMRKLLANSEKPS